MDELLPLGIVYLRLPFNSFSTGMTTQAGRTKNRASITTSDNLTLASLKRPDQMHQADYSPALPHVFMAWYLIKRPKQLHLNINYTKHKQSQNQKD
jgi:hypothetical protein